MNSLKSSAIAYSNIALVKYWGRHPRLAHLNIPLNDSVSMTKEGMGKIKLQSHTTIEFSSRYKSDSGSLNGKKMGEKELARMRLVVDPLREAAGVPDAFRLASQNDFPTAAGLASSAAGFAALARAAADALQLDYSLGLLSSMARLGSGSAARSLHGGLVWWHAGHSHESSYAEQLCGPNDFPLRAVVAVVNPDAKKVSSLDGHSAAASSPFQKMQVKESLRHAKRMRVAIAEKDFPAVGQLAEQNALNMHAVMMTANPSLLYWEPGTLKVMHAVRSLREKGAETYFTIDAGPNVHCLCRPRDQLKLDRALQVAGIRFRIPVRPAKDSYIARTHLF
ncbi:MAG: diphosphomevalonate decarboxylase [Candidatus Diapherotrites archaeon]|nr:diphosphomevalonate decarboxylase [Candidatus Diapherotrites archaeon]